MHENTKANKCLVNIEASSSEVLRKTDLTQKVEEKNWLESQWSLARFKIDFECWNDKSRMFSFKSRMCLRDGERECVPSSFNVQTNNLEMPAKEFTFTRSLYMSSSSFLSLLLLLFHLFYLLFFFLFLSTSSHFPFLTLWIRPNLSLLFVCIFCTFRHFLLFHFFQFTNF